MDKVTQSTAATAEETAAAAEELNSQASTMKSSVNELSQLIGGGSRVTETRPEATRMNSNPHGNGNGLVISQKQTVIKSVAKSEPLSAAAADHRPAAIPLKGDVRDF
jgi:hypothetical protein